MKKVKKVRQGPSRSCGASDPATRRRVVVTLALLGYSHQAEDAVTDFADVSDVAAVETKTCVCEEPPEHIAFAKSLAHWISTKLRTERPAWMRPLLLEPGSPDW
jgi:hypothetical protein